jgi:hypothetical protein
MKIHLFWKGFVVMLLIALSVTAYKTTATEPELSSREKQCCHKKSTCPKENTSKYTGESIIFDSISDNLLFIHI